MIQSDLKLPWRSRLAWRLYGYLLIGAEDVLKRCFRYVLLLKNLRIPIVILRGPTRLNAHPGTVIAAGDEHGLDYLIRRFFEGEPRREMVGKVPVWALPRTLERLRSSADLTVARVDRLSARLLFNADYLAVPEWVGTWLTVPDDPVKLVHASHSAKEDLRVVRGNGLTSEVSHAEADFDMFYNTMYVPFIRRRHGKRAAVRNVYWLRRCFHQGGILWVLHGGRRIAGVFFQQWGQTLHLLALGTANGEWAPVKAGAIAALYYYSVEHARDLGCKTVDFGGSRPALTDGVLCYKRKWGMRLVEKRGSSYDFLVHWAYMDKPVTAFLAHTPLIFRDRGGLSAVAAIDGEGPVVLTEAWTIHHTMWIPGLRRLSLVAASGWESDNDAPPQTRLIDLTTVGDCDPRMLLAWTTDLRRSVRLRGLGPIGVIGREQRFDRLYWDHVVEEIRRGVSLCVWRAYMRRVYQRLVWDWLPAPEVGRGLKTDLFEEAVTSHHLLPDLGPGSVGVDSSLTVVRAARKRLGGAGEPCLFIVGDLRRLPLRSGCVMRILAGSSLDHFPERRDIAVSLAELARVLAAGGTLVITFDNPHNPIVWLRNWLPFAWLNRLRLVPYYVGATYGRTEARAQLEAFGLVVTNEGTVAHTPRAPAIWLVALVERLRWGRLETLMARILDGFETLERWPTRYRTGYYLTLRAEKRQLANDG